MSEKNNTYLPEQGEIDRTKIEGYSLRSGAFYSWLKESGYTVSQIAERLDIDEKEFFSFANIIISGGLNTALIQKKEADKDDYNTVFTISFILAVILYFILFFTAPLIAEIYNQPILISIIRVLGLSLPIYALKSIVCAYIMWLK